MAKLIGAETVNALTERWYYDAATDSFHLNYTSDSQPLIDRIAAISAAGEAPNVEGLGRCIGEADDGFILEYCMKRGIPWEKFMYSNEYDAEWPKMFAEHRRLAYENHGKQQAAH